MTWIASGNPASTVEVPARTTPAGQPVVLYSPQKLPRTAGLSGGRVNSVGIFSGALAMTGQRMRS